MRRRDVTENDGGQKTFDQHVSGLGVMGWLVLGVVAAACAGAGNLAAKVSGFPYYPGWQGVFVQQPTAIIGWGAAALLLVLVLGVRIGVSVARPLDARIGAALGAMVLVGYSLRGGTMGSVMQAADGREVFGRLAIELGALSLLVISVFVLRGFLGGRRYEQVDDGSGPATWLAAGVQLAVYTALVVLLGQSNLKAQAMMTVFGAGVLATMAAETLTGRIWRFGWVIPLVVGVAGYCLVAELGRGVEIAVVQGWLAGFSSPLPLDYAALGPAGIMLGKLLSGNKAAPER